MKRNDVSVGSSTQVVIVFDNATGHNKLLDETTSPKRSWRKELIIKWLKRHNIPLSVKAAKAELIELTFSNLPEKRYVTDKLVAKYSIAILRYHRNFPNIFSLNIIPYSLPIQCTM